MKRNKKTECGALDWKDFLYLIDCLKKDKNYTFCLLIATGCNTGLRISDILRLTWEMILHKDQFTIQEKKTKKDRLISINHSYKEIIELCHKELMAKKAIQENDIVFANRWGNPCSLQYINHKLHEIIKRYGINVKNGSTHILRKGFALRIFLQNNESEYALILLSQIFNHSSIQITRRYLGIQEQTIQNVYLNL
jgi:site-specific recombinase XerD